MEDVRFTIEDVLLNEELSPMGMPAWLRTGGKSSGTPMEFEIIDDNTFKIKFDNPYGGFLVQASVESWRGYTDLIKPAHFLKKYHKKYADPEELEKEIAEAKFEPGEWVNLFNLKEVGNWECCNPEAIGYPVLYPYIQIKSGDVIELERNPYYFKVDVEGNQLPYIDKMVSTMTQDPEMASMKILAGEVDHSGEYVPLTKIAMYKENEAKNGYKLILQNMHRTSNDIYLNLSNKDPVWRQVVQDVRFRKALNYALDKHEIVDTIFYGMASPAEMQGTESNLEEANKLLDEMGMKKGPDGFRVGPDGKKFTIPFEVALHGPDMADLTELVIEQWKQLGLDVTMQQIDTTLHQTRMDANELKATIFWTHGPTMLWWSEWGQGFWAPIWWRWWNTRGQEGEEPPEDVKEFYRLCDSIYEVSLADAQKVAQDIHKNMAENLWYFVHTIDIKLPVVVNNKLSNISEKGFGVAHLFAGEQWFFEK